MPLDPQFVGRRIPAHSVFIDGARLRFFAKAIGDTSPALQSADHAAALGYDGVPVPPTYLFALHATDRPGLVPLLEEAGGDYRHLLHGEQRFAFHDRIRVGDTLTFDGTIERIYEKKAGELQFLEAGYRIHNQHGRHVADMGYTMVLRYPAPGAR